MNLQQIFDKVSNHLLTQNRHALLSPDQVFEPLNNNCAYRNKEGLSCAVGCLISNSAYRVDMEDIDFEINKLVKDSLKNILGSGNEYDKKINLLCDLQNVHDKHHVKNWSKALQKCATKYKLIFANPA